MECSLVPYGESDEESGNEELSAAACGVKRGLEDGEGVGLLPLKRVCLPSDIASDGGDGDLSDASDSMDERLELPDESRFETSLPLWSDTPDDLMAFVPEHVEEVADEDLLADDLAALDEDGECEYDSPDVVGEEVEDVSDGAGENDELLARCDGLKVRRRGKPDLIDALCTNVMSANDAAHHMAGELSVEEELVTDTWVAFESLRIANQIQCEKDIDKVELLARSFGCFLGPVSFSALVLASKFLPKSKLRVFCAEAGKEQRISACSSTYLGRCSIGTTPIYFLCDAHS
jgi:hypothetical protein